MKLKISKGRLFLFAVLLVTGVMTRYIFSDINLDVDLLRKSLENMPAVVLENIEFEREISGDLWRATIPVATRRDELVEVQSIDVWRTFTDGREWYLWGKRGFYSEAAASADVTGLTGTLETEERLLNMKSPALSWTRDASEFLFPRGLTVYDSEFTMESTLATFDAEGVMTLKEGAVIRWNRVDE